MPTGRNFFSLDNRAVPTPTAWSLGERSAENMLLRHFQDHGVFPRAIGRSVWGTANMRTGGDDIAQALALMGVRPRFDGYGRLAGATLIPLEELGRPRIDVISTNGSRPKHPTRARITGTRSSAHWS